MHSSTVIRVIDGITHTIRRDANGVNADAEAIRKEGEAWFCPMQRQVMASVPRHLVPDQWPPKWNLNATITWEQCIDEDAAVLMTAAGPSFSLTRSLMVAYYRGLGHVLSFDDTVKPPTFTVKGVLDEKTHPLPLPDSHSDNSDDPLQTDGEVCQWTTRGGEPCTNYADYVTSSATGVIRVCCEEHRCHWCPEGSSPQMASKSSIQCNSCYRHGRGKKPWTSWGESPVPGKRL